MYTVDPSLPRNLMKTSLFKDFQWWQKDFSSLAQTVIFLKTIALLSPLYTIVVNYGMSVSSKQIKSHVFFQPKTAIFGWDSSWVKDRWVLKSNKALRRAVAPRQLHKRGPQANWASSSDSNPSFVDVYITRWHRWQMCHSVRASPPRKTAWA